MQPTILLGGEGQVVAALAETNEYKQLQCSPLPG